MVSFSWSGGVGEYFVSRKEEAGGSDMLGQEVRRDIASALVPYRDFFIFKLITDVMKF